MNKKKKTALGMLPDREIAQCPLKSSHIWSTLLQKFQGREIIWKVSKCVGFHTYISAIKSMVND